jgi:hypothetical protein
MLAAADVLNQGLTIEQGNGFNRRLVFIVATKAIFPFNLE